VIQVNVSYERLTYEDIEIISSVDKVYICHEICDFKIYCESNITNDILDCIETDLNEVIKIKIIIQ
jgi:hypothetical protein